MSRQSKKIISLAVLIFWTATILYSGQTQTQTNKTTNPGTQGPVGGPPPPPPKSQKDKGQDKKKGGEDDQAIELSSDLVTVPFSVTDKRNAYINDLKKEDIRVLEDNKPQQIFSLVHETDLPLTMVLLMDTSYSQQLTIPEQRDAALKFFRSVMKPNKDTAAIVTFEGESDLIQKLTSNTDRLTRALDSVIVNLPAGAVGTPPINGSSRSGSTAIYDAIYATVDDLLAHEAGRRVIILLTDGDENSSRIKMSEAIERAWKSEVQIYAIGVAGEMRDPGGYGIYHTNVQRGTLNKICEETGGRLFVPTREADLYSAFRQLEDDLRQQYILSYSPTNNKHDGTFRSIKVEVATRNDLQVRHRRGYFAQSQKG
ncbi:MAG TPA: VWA domain-containing protein [Blastocatellia bacterium]|nr:VWA domain-containing protein [Blastocatellia bacterium]